MTLSKRDEVGAAKKRAGQPAGKRHRKTEKKPSQKRSQKGKMSPGLLLNLKIRHLFFELSKNDLIKINPKEN